MNNVFAMVRFPIAVVFSLTLASSLFWILWTLTSVEFKLEEVKAVRIDFTRMRQDTQTASRREEKVELEPPPVAPDVPKLAVSSGGVDNNIMTLAPTIDTSSAMTGIKLGGGSDRDVMPLVRINPDYPPRALSRGIEGWVQIQFTITATGTVKDAVVIKSSSQIFEEAAIKAILRWRYNPKIENGEGVERVGMQTILRFELED
jgi:periplasmic protein TonB